MADKLEPPENAASADHRATTPSHREARAAALQKALRDNLRRRKQAQASEGDPAGAKTLEAPARDQDAKA